MKVYYVNKESGNPRNLTELKANLNKKDVYVSEYDLRSMKQ